MAVNTRQVKITVVKRPVVITAKARGPQGKDGTGGSGAVASVFGRTGTVVATSGDYDDTQISVDDTDLKAATSNSVTGATVHAIFNSLITWVKAQISGLTKSSVGLGNVDNTSDATKPVSGPQLTALNLKEDKANKNQVNGYAGLGADGKLLSAQLPALAITDTYVVGSQAAMLALSGADTGDVAVRTDLNKSFILKGTSYSTLSDWQELLTPTDSVTSVNGRSGAVTGLAEQTSLDATNTAVGLKYTKMVPTAVKTSNYTASANDLVPVDTTSGPVTITLPTTPADGALVAVKHTVQGGTNGITVNCGGSAKFNRTGGATSNTLSLLAQSSIMQYQASTDIWYIIADDIPLSQLDARFFAPRVNQLTDAASVSLDVANYEKWKLLTVSQATTFSVTGTPKPMKAYVLRFKSTAAWGLTWPASFRNVAATLPTSTVANKVQYVGVIYNADESTYDVMAVGVQP